MASESISSLPVLDHQGSVIGNISQVDTKVIFHYGTLQAPYITPAGYATLFCRIEC